MTNRRAQTAPPFIPSQLGSGLHGLDGDRRRHLPVPAAGRDLHLPAAQPSAARHDLRSDPQMSLSQSINQQISASPARRSLMVLGIVALCQPWSLFLHRYGVTIMLVGLIGFTITRQDRAGRAGRHDGASTPTSRGHGMTQIELRDVEKYLRRRPRHPDAQPDDRRQRVRRAARPVGLRQDHDAARHRRAGDIDSGDILIDGKPVQHLQGRRPRHRLRVPVVRALSAPDASTRTSPSRCARRARARPRSTSAVREVAKALQHRRTCSTSGRRRCPAATCSASPSAGRWCAGRRRC